jgi:UDP-N-acetylmuramyl tripeptide synthase
LFGLDTPADVAVLEAHTKASGRAVFSRGGVLWAAAGAHESPVIHLADVPITFGGLAIYNVENVAAAVAAAVALNLPLPEIAEALRSFGASKNPGRGELVDRNGVRVFADFAHNAAGVLALKPLMDGLKSASKLFVIAGAAGDRRDDELVELADAVASLAPEWVFVRDLKGYERGRAPGEVPALLLRELAQHGVRGEEATGEVVALKAALQRAVPGDVIALLAHIERDEVAVFLATKEP